MIHIQNFIGGRFCDSHAQQRLENVEPATGRVYSTVPDSTEPDIRDAVTAAQTAFPAWSQTPAAERSRLLLRLADLIEANLELLARAESIDTGKPIKAARAVDIPRAAANFRFFATAILHAHTEAHQTDRRALNLTLRQPRGVAGCISPWNLPLYLLTWKIAPALATGNTVVAKPSEVTPMTAFKLGELAKQAGVPDGVLNIVQGRGQTAGAALVAHPNVPTITFTGGTKTGADIARVAAPMFKHLALELGGKNPTLVFADANLDRAVPQAVRAAFSNQGQICLCGSRLLVDAAIYDKFLDAFIATTLKWKLGDPLDETTDIGALVSKPHWEKVRGCIDLAQSEGGRVILGGKVPTGLPSRCANGYFLEPTVIGGLNQTCRTNREEIFGPVVTVQPFASEEEALRIANGVNYGLAASVWTENLSRAHRVAEQLEVGTVWVNCWMLRDLRVPFGGLKHSGVGKEGGDEALRFFTEAKNVCMFIGHEPQ